MKNDKLLHRLNRISGQIEALKKRLHHDQDDCVVTLQQLKACVNGLKKFGEAYIQSHMKDCLAQKDLDQAAMQKQLEKVISSAFFL